MKTIWHVVLYHKQLVALTNSCDIKVTDTLRDALFMENQFQGDKWKRCFTHILSYILPSPASNWTTFNVSWSWISHTCIWLAINGSCLLKGRSAVGLRSWWCGWGPVALRILLLWLQSTLGRRCSCDRLARPQCSVLAVPMGWWVGHNGVKWGPKVGAAWCRWRILMPLRSRAVILSVVICRHGIMLLVWMWWVLGGYRGNRVGTDGDLGWRSRVKSRPRAWGCPSLSVAVGVVVGAVVCARWWRFSRRSILRRHGLVSMLRNAGIVIRGRIHRWVSLTWSCGMKKKQEKKNEAPLQTNLKGVMVQDWPLCNIMEQLMMKRLPQKHNRFNTHNHGMERKTTELPLIFIIKSIELPVYQPVIEVTLQSCNYWLIAPMPTDMYDSSVPLYLVHNRKDTSISPPLIQYYVGGEPFPELFEI